MQFTRRAWLAAYSAVAYRHVSLDVRAALAAARQRGLGEAAAAAALLSGLAARLPHARHVELRGLPPVAAGLPPVAAALRWQLGELLLAALGGSAMLRHLSCDFLLHLPALLEQRRQHGLRLDSLGVSAVPTADVLRYLPLLGQQPLVELEVADAACLGDGASAALAAALAALPRLASLRLGGGGAGSGASMGGAFRPPGAAGPAAASSSDTSPPGVCLPSLALVSAAAALPGLHHLELSLTFGRKPTAPQQVRPCIGAAQAWSCVFAQSGPAGLVGRRRAACRHQSLERPSPASQVYLQQLGAVLHQQQRQREEEAAAACSSGGSPLAPAEGSKVSVTVHEVRGPARLPGLLWCVLPGCCGCRSACPPGYASLPPLPSPSPLAHSTAARARQPVGRWGPGVFAEQECMRCSNTAPFALRCTALPGTTPTAFGLARPPPPTHLRCPPFVLQCPWPRARLTSTGTTSRATR